MAGGSDSQRDAAAGAGAGGCAVFLIDESTAMDARVAEGTKSKADCLATALNSLLGQLSSRADLDVAVVGYRGDGRGGIDVACRWQGPLQGRTFVPGGQLADAPMTVEHRVRKVPGPGGIGIAREDTVPFPVWYAPRLGEAASAAEAHAYCRELLAACRSSRKPPLVVSLVGELLPPGSLPAAVDGLRQMQFPGGPPLVFHAHLGSSARIPPTLYPSADGHLPPGEVREIFQCSSDLPDPLAAALREAGIAVNPGARGMIYNARMVDLIRFLGLVKTYAKYPPPVATAGSSAAVAAPVSQVSDRIPASPQAAVEPLALIVLLLDRSVDDPSDQSKNKVWTRLQEHANELLGHIAQCGQGRIETAVVCYGADAEGRTEVQTHFAGPLAGRTFVRDTELAGGALRVEETTQQVSNGIGGLIAWIRKRPIFVDLEPTAAAAVGPAMAAAGELVSQWCGRHPGSPLPPIVLHLTRGRPDPDELQQAADRLRQIDAAGRGVLLYHLVVTEAPHRSLAYPGQPSGIEDPVLLKLWELSSPLLAGERLAVEKPAVAVDSRGFVINGKFDLLSDGVLKCMSL